MARRIERLTEAQRAAMPAFAEDWIRIGLSTDRADRPLFVRGMTAAYRAARIDPPARVVWVDSPRVLAMAGPISGWLLTGARVPDAASAGAADTRVEAAVREATGLPDAIVRATVAVAVARSHAPLTQHIQATWSQYLGGQFWAGGWWYGPAYQQFFIQVCGLELDPALMQAAQANADVTRAACWWWPHRDFCVVSERPLAIHRERVPGTDGQPDTYRLHAETGAAVAWPDGWGVWAWHGVRVPRHVIEAPETITAAAVQAEPNAEVRRVLIERMGWDRWLAETGARPRQSDAFGDLYEVTMDGATLGVVVVTNSTPEPDGTRKRYALRVPPGLRTAHAAVAATFGLTAATYRPVVET